MIARGVRTVKNRGPKGAVLMLWRTVLWRALRLCRQTRATIGVHGFRMIVNLNDPCLSRELFVCRDRERTLGWILRRVLEPGMNVLDVGGNLGYYPLLESGLVGKKGRVYALEPFPPNFELLVSNIALNGREDRITAYEVAASDRVGKARFHVSRASNLGTMFATGKSTGLQLTGQVIEVSTTDLTRIIDEMDRIDLIRMDTEGVEVPILRGLMAAIRSGSFTGRIVTEIHADSYGADNDIVPVLEELSTLGYRSEFVSSDDEPSQTFRLQGYEPERTVRESNTRVRGIYRDISRDDLCQLVCEEGAVRDLVLAKDTG